MIRIRRAAVRTKARTSITTPKSDAGVRDVAIPPHVIPLIEAHLAKHVGTGRDSLIFPADDGGHLQPITLYRHWYEARDAAGRPDLRFHDLRHSRRGAGRGDRRHAGRADGPPRALAHRRPRCATSTPPRAATARLPRCCPSWPTHPDLSHRCDEMPCRTRVITNL